MFNWKSHGFEKIICSFHSILSLTRLKDNFLRYTKYLFKNVFKMPLKTHNYHVFKNLISLQRRASRNH